MTSSTSIHAAQLDTLRVQQELELAGAELHLTNVALDNHLPPEARRGDVERALEQNAVIEDKVQEAAADLAVVSERLAHEVAERGRLERELAAARKSSAR
jgi:hypothetical protein